MARARPNPEQLIAAAPMSEALRALARRGEARHYRRGTVLAEEGDTGDTLFVILDGRVRAFGRHAGSEREITYGIYGAGEYVGEMSLDGGPRSASLEVAEDAVCVRIARPQLETFIAEQPAFAFELLAKVIRRARAATLSLKQMALNDVYGRLKHLLESDASLQPDGMRRMAEPLSQLQIAQRIGCGREMVSRVMKDLQAGGHVAIGTDRRIVLKKPLPARW